VKVSVVLSYYRQPIILERTLYIWSQQTFPYQDYEVLVMDGGQADLGIAVARLYRELHPDFNLRYFTYDGRVKWMCPVHAWNVGIKQARGEIVIVTMEDRLTSFDAVGALYAPHAKRESIFCTVLPWLMEGTVEDNLIGTVDWRANPKFLWAIARPTIIATGQKRENESVMFSLPRQTMIDLRGFDERWRDYGYWMLSLYQRFLDYGLRPYEVSWIPNVHHHHHRHGTMRAHLYDGEARRDQWETIKELNCHGVYANLGLHDWGVMDGDEEIEL
jgi:glycosyltransferase involved in cell wall biosynthesis